jgi:riboflavin kinase/FMN adenylyltransferase
MENLYGDVGFSKLVVGYDHAFGKDREGDVELLNKLASENSFDIERFGAKSVGDIVVSSTKIRNALKNSEIQAANQMLGYDYFVIGKVVEGDKRGRTIGFPTANVEPDEPLKLLPGNGVYAVSLVVDDRWYAGVCNIGHRPTFRDDSQKTVEVHIPGSTLDLYGRQVRVVFHTFVREEKKFNGANQIISQIKQDIEEARKSLKDLDSISEYINFADYIDIQNS